MKRLVPPAALLLALVLQPMKLQAHCDTVDGPVAADAKRALAAGDPKPVLKWVRAADEEAVRAAFSEASRVRGLSSEARELADRFFLETLVRLHRAGEGASFSGLKPAGSADPLFRHADETLTGEPVDPLVAELAKGAAEGLRARHARAKALRAAAGDDVARGREAVAAYVEYLHYVEGLHAAIQGGAHHED